MTVAIMDGKSVDPNVVWPARDTSSSLVPWTLAALTAACLDAVAKYVNRWSYVSTDAIAFACTSATTWFTFSFTALVGVTGRPSPSVIGGVMGGWYGCGGGIVFGGTCPGGHSLACVVI